MPRWSVAVLARRSLAEHPSQGQQEDHNSFMPCRRVAARGFAQALAMSIGVTPVHHLSDAAAVQIRIAPGRHLAPGVVVDQNLICPSPSWTADPVSLQHSRHASLSRSIAPSGQAKGAEVVGLGVNLVAELERHMHPEREAVHASR